VEVGCDRAELVGLDAVLKQDAAVREQAVARPEATRGGDRRQLVPAQVHRLLDRAAELLPGAVDLGTVRERRAVVRDVVRLADQLDEGHCSLLARERGG
jgi:hypothetical protein